MADYIVIRKTDPESTDPKDWKVVGYHTGLSANGAGMMEALRLSYEGPGRYGALSATEGATALVTEVPKVTADAEAKF